MTAEYGLWLPCAHMPTQTCTHMNMCTHIFSPEKNLKSLPPQRRDTLPLWYLRPKTKTQWN